MPPFLTNANSIFTPTQLNAIAEKGLARKLAFQQAQGLPQYGADPSGMFAPYSTRTGDGTRPDSVNIFFGGVGSPWDIVWDMTNTGTYSTPYDPSNGLVTGGTEGNGIWHGSICHSRQHLRIGTGQESVLIESTAEVRSRECELVPDFDRSQFHMRIWGGGLHPTHGNWSVGTAHWDPDHNHDCGSFLFEESERNVVESFTDGDGNPLWFVADIWQFPVPGAESVPLRSPDDPAMSLEECAAAGAAPADVMHYYVVTDGIDKDYYEDPQPVPPPPGMDECPSCPVNGDGQTTNNGLNTNPGGDGWGSDQPDGVAHYIQLVA